MAATAAALDFPSAPTHGRSAGPLTPEVMAHSSANSIRHGLYTSLTLLSPAERAIFDLIAASLPFTLDCEHLDLQAAATEVALLTYRLDRTRRLQFAFFSEGIRALCEREGIPEPQDPAQRSVLEVRLLQEDRLGPRVMDKLESAERFFVKQLAPAWHNYRAKVDYLQVTGQLAEDRIQPPAELGSFSQPCEHAGPPAVSPARNAPCPCGSGEKFKNCCGRKAPRVLNL